MPIGKNAIEDRKLIQIYLEIDDLEPSTFTEEVCAGSFLLCPPPARFAPPVTEYVPLQ